MSYVVVRRMPSSGAIHGALGGIAACGCRGDCVGDEMDLSNCCCCSWDGWRNEVYYDLKGGESHRHLNELRLQHAFAFLAKEEIENVSYDEQGAPIRAGFIDGVARAIANYNAIYPMSRWKKIEDIRDSGECGPYDVWSTTRLTDEQNAAAFAAIQNATRMSGAAAFTAWYGEPEWECGAIVPLYAGKCSRTWRAKANGVVNTVPSSEPTRFVVDRPTRKEIYSVADGQLGPSPWMSAFLDVFASGWESKGTGLAASLAPQRLPARTQMQAVAARSALSMKSRTLANKLVAVERQHADALMPTGKRPAKRPARNIVPDTKVGTYVAVAGAALLLGGAVFLHIRRGRRAGGRR